MDFNSIMKNDFKGKVITYQNVDLLVVEQFEYKNDFYLYTINIEKVNNDEIEITFLRKKSYDVFEHIDDAELLKELFTVVSGMVTEEELKKVIEDFND